MKKNKRVLNFKSIADLKLQLIFRFGRRTCSLIALVIQTVVEAILSVSPNYWFYIAFLIVQGIALNFTYLGVYVWGKC